jgi:hypothetical protein
MSFYFLTQDFLDIFSELESKISVQLSITPCISRIVKLFTNICTKLTVLFVFRCPVYQCVVFWELSFVTSNTSSIFFF